MPAVNSPSRPAPGKGLAEAPSVFDLAGPGRDLVKGRPEEDWTPHRPERGWEKSEGGQRFKLVSEYAPAGDQVTAIPELVEGIETGETDQVLLGATGTGKTFTMASIIDAVQRPALILAPNKTLAAQLYGEFKSFFPENAVEYFVSYYDYYTPEAYVPRADLYIEKESSINEAIDRMRHSATRAILERDDVIIVASVSCIYGIGSVETYTAMTKMLEPGMRMDPGELARLLTGLQYTRNDLAFGRGTFRVAGDTVDIFPSHLDDRAWKVGFFGDELESVTEFDPLTGRRIQELPRAKIYAASHYVTPRPTLNQAVDKIRAELKATVQHFEKHGKLLEAQRIQERTTFDIEMMLATGSCNGIENYSRYLTGRKPGDPPPTMFEYLPDNALVFTDESHQTVPQIGAMYKGDFSRKHTLAEYGFRLPSCKDNRPLRFEEWDAMRPQTVHVSATPGPWELERTGGVFTEQVIRPTGLLDPEVEVRPVSKDGANQVDDIMDEIRKTTAKGYRTLCTTLTKKMAEDLTDYLAENGIRVRYMHSDIDTVERIEIIRDLRLGHFDVLVGINLLREGLDIPECGLVGILDADKEGFLRSETSLVQTIGRAARNADARVILYGDRITGSMQRAIEETERRRAKQMAHNLEHGITPTTVKREVADILKDLGDSTGKSSGRGARKTQRGKALAGDASDLAIAADGSAAYDAGAPMGGNMKAVIADLEGKMRDAAANLEFEEAARLRDEVKRMREGELGL